MGVFPFTCVYIIRRLDKRFNGRKTQPKRIKTEALRLLEIERQ